MEVEKDPAAAYRYTNKGNLVGVISNGSAVLGLGNIGPLAGKPVMEGKAMLFKKFAGIDVFDIEVDAPSPEAFIETVAHIAPTFGAINLEDIAAPECFFIEGRLRQRLNIPVMHDDQHGTAVVACAALLNAMELQGKKPENARVLILGAGAAAIAIAKLAMRMFGFRKRQLMMFDSKGSHQHRARAVFADLQTRLCAGHEGQFVGGRDAAVRHCHRRFQGGHDQAADDAEDAGQADYSGDGESHSGKLCPARRGRRGMT